MQVFPSAQTETQRVLCLPADDCQDVDVGLLLSLVSCRHSLLTSITDTFYDLYILVINVAITYTYLCFQMFLLSHIFQMFLLSHIF